MRRAPIPLRDRVKRRCEERHVGSVAEHALLLVDERGGLPHLGWTPFRPRATRGRAGTPACVSLERSSSRGAFGKSSDPVYARTRAGD